MKLKKLLMFTFVFALMALAGCSSGGAKSLETIKKDGKIVVATNAEFAPFEYKDGSKFVGIDMEIIQGYATYIGVECEIADQDFDAALLSVSTNKADIAIAGITKNEKREETLAFTDSYFTANQTVIVLADGEYASLTTQDAILAALTADKAKIGVQRGTTGEYYASGDADWGYDGIADTTVSSYDNGGLAVQDLVTGKVDAVIIDVAPANILATKYNADSSTAEIKVLDVVLTEEEYAIACDKGNDTLIASLNEYIAKIKADGTFDTIVSKYYAEN